MTNVEKIFELQAISYFEATRFSFYATWIEIKNQVVCTCVSGVTEVVLFEKQVEISFFPFGLQFF